MIAVIADDFTGAAEIGGLGLRHGLEVAICTTVPPATTADLLVIAADTRSKAAPEAVAQMRQLTGDLRALHPRLLYKKVDSVLRGHILPELAAQLDVLGAKRALVVPANPAFGRCISEGIYYVKGKKLHETSFGTDPEFAISSSHVLDILKARGEASFAAGESPVLAQPGDALPSARFIIGEAGSSDDLNRWAGKVDDDMLAAGASGFFSALLDQLRGGSQETERVSAMPEQLRPQTGPGLVSPNPEQASAGSGKSPGQKLTPGSPVLSSGAQSPAPAGWGEKKLFVFGSAFSTSKAVVSELLEKGKPVFLLPEEWPSTGTDAENSPEHFAEEVARSILRDDYAVIAAGNVQKSWSPADARAMREKMAGLAAEVMQRVPVAELLLEGGATAAAVLGALRLETFYPLRESAGGVIRMRVSGKEGLHITVKPGSYSWPEEIRALINF